MTKYEKLWNNLSINGQASVFSLMNSGEAGVRLDDSHTHYSWEKLSIAERILVKAGMIATGNDET